MLNLISSAIKHTPPRTIITLRSAIQPAPDDAGRLLIVESERGCGARFSILLPSPSPAAKPQEITSGGTADHSAEV
jgi:signal transduction histidine kinase